LVVVGVRRAEAGREIARGLAQQRRRASVLEIDVSDAARVMAAAHEFAQQWDHLEVSRLGKN
jgi:NAD(P)-dependent dehydrogenase (short-subunit alcohol dehydrogenase family)